MPAEQAVDAVCSSRTPVQRRLAVTTATATTADLHVQRLGHAVVAVVVVVDAAQVAVTIQKSVSRPVTGSRLFARRHCRRSESFLVRHRRKRDGLRLDETADCRRGARWRVGLSGSRDGAGFAVVGGTHRGTGRWHRTRAESDVVVLVVVYEDDSHGVDVLVVRLRRFFRQQDICATHDAVFARAQKVPVLPISVRFWKKLSVEFFVGSSNQCSIKSLTVLVWF